MYRYSLPHPFKKPLASKRGRPPEIMSFHSRDASFPQKPQTPHSETLPRSHSTKSSIVLRGGRLPLGHLRAQDESAAIDPALAMTSVCRFFLALAAVLATASALVPCPHLSWASPAGGLRAPQFHLARMSKSEATSAPRIGSREHIHRVLFDEPQTEGFVLPHPRSHARWSFAVVAGPHSPFVRRMLVLSVKKHGFEVGPSLRRPGSSRTDVLRPQRVAIPVLPRTKSFMPELGVAEKLIISLVNTLFLIPPIRGRCLT